VPPRNFCPHETEGKEMSKPKQMTVTNQSLIKELTESVAEYTGACEETLRGEKGMRRVRGMVAEVLVSLPGESNDVAGWNPLRAELMAEKLTDVALAYEGMMERINEQVTALRRMNKAIIAVKEEALNG
jgi:hypothetical protein